ncbi:SDR family oxidoreductase [bacterium]|nr:MAG: SDR family oxidoreductase [bacterium]
MSTNNKVALITGANKGIGLETARQLGQNGLTVLIGARDAGRGEEAAAKLREDGLDAHFVELDVTKPATIAAAKVGIERDYGRLDVLVNNAGIALDMAPPSEASLDVTRQTYETNFFGVIALTQALLPLLHKSEAGRIVNVSSGLGSLTLASDPNWEHAAVNAFAYCSSKTALNAFTVRLAKELAETKIKVNSTDPGYTATDLNGFQGNLTPEQAARVTVRMALIGEDGPNGRYFSEDGELGW